MQDAFSEAARLALPAATLVYLAAAASDIAARIIPDRLSVALVILAASSAGIVGGWVPAATTAALAALAFLLLLPLALLGWLGGGDVKLLAASAGLAGPAGIAPLLLGTALAGGVLSLLYLAAFRLAVRLPAPGSRPVPRQPGIPDWRRRLDHAVRAERRRLARRGPLPYAVAISAGALAALTGIH
jgi:prepilin peptidase CpaA